MKYKGSPGITEIIIQGLNLIGTIAVACSSSRFISLVMPKIVGTNYRRNKKKKKYFHSTFSYLKNQGFIQANNRNGQIYISLTEEGKKKAGKYQINDLEIKKPKKWDRKWQILIFDIKDKDRIKREALRGKIKELGLFQLQKSVWIYPYDFQPEINLLRDFFKLTDKEIQIIVADKIENDREAKNFFSRTIRLER